MYILYVPCCTVTTQASSNTQKRFALTFFSGCTWSVALDHPVEMRMAMNGRDSSSSSNDYGMYICGLSTSHLFVCIDMAIGCSACAYSWDS